MKGAARIGYTVARYPNSLSRVSRKTAMKLKYLAYALAMGSLTTAAMAQTPTGVVAPGTKPTVAAATAPASVPAPAAVLTSKDVNPFSGTPLSYEQATLALAVQKLQTSILDEQVKQASLRGDLGNIALRKQAEASSVQTSIVKELVAQKEATATTTTKTMPAVPSVPRVATVKPVVKPKPATRNLTAPKAEPAVSEAAKPVAAPVVQAPVSGVKEVQAILSSGGQYSAIINTTEGLAVYKDGSTTPWGPIQVTETYVMVNGAKYQVHSTTLGRFANEKQEVKNPNGTTSVPGPAGSAPIAINPSTGVPVGAPVGLPADFGRTNVPPVPSSSNGLPVSSVIGLPSAAQ